MEKGSEIISLVSNIREKANKLIADELRKNGISDLVSSHGAILVQLYRSDDLCMKDIAERVGKDKSTVTALVNKLVKLGYIYKVKNSEDSRITHLKLTDKGREVEEIFFKVSHVLVDRVYRGFDEQEKDHLIKMMNKLLENF